VATLRGRIRFGEIGEDGIEPQKVDSSGLQWPHEWLVSRPRSTLWICRTELGYKLENYGAAGFERENGCRSYTFTAEQIRCRENKWSFSGPLI
jgi:hypothetical protein